MANKQPKISIIIPVFNRAVLLPFTLDSILRQTFADWECILVDDGSMDSSFCVMEQYQKKDARFKAYKRPDNLKKGANACRNYGFLQSSGSYIKWFDSDDIMLPEHLDVAYRTLVGNALDFVVTDTQNFSHETGELLGKPYWFKKNDVPISDWNLALGQTGWITDDFLGKRKVVEIVKFNEYIVDGDEYNFSVKLLQQNIRGVFIDAVLTHRRVHSGAVSTINRTDDLTFLFINTSIKYQTAYDLVAFNNVELIRWFMSGYMQYAHKLALNNKKVPFKFKGFKLICNYYSIFKGLAFLVALLTASCFKKGYNIMKYARK
ncbi:glycosyltransferase family 2 protein [Flavobacteriaceae bacterium XHP0103]|uniref:glycosyltransferase family 2 protein n=1 Tax=Marixanthotalea marina TaxID=2844359 RepID=UPI002989D4CA|nr:glycosyltransferase family 2 protein [Marixanthotalea marina]MBU3822741.1 glycosyltransferase family 2 protein [Marixanthotalea marina]